MKVMYHSMIEMDRVFWMGNLAEFLRMDGKDKFRKVGFLVVGGFVCWRRTLCLLRNGSLHQRSRDNSSTNPWIHRRKNVVLLVVESEEYSHKNQSNPNSDFARVSINPE